MNELQPTNNQQVAMLETAFNTEQRKAKLFANSSIVPKDYQSSQVGEQKAIANCFVAMNMAQRMKADPFMIMQNLYIVNGRPSFSSSFLIATINACGRFEPLHWSKIEKRGEAVLSNGTTIPNYSCFAYTRAKGSDIDLIGTTIDMQMAVNEGWYGKTASKWQTMPEQMLKYRASAFWVRQYCPEIAMGLLTNDELIDIDNKASVEDTEAYVVEENNEEEILQEIAECKTIEDLTNVNSRHTNILANARLNQAIEDKAKEIKSGVKN